MQRAGRPIVLVPACQRMLGLHPFHVAGRKYVDAVRLADCQPLVVPVAHDDEFDDLLDLADGVLLTGSASNVHPRHFGEDVHDASLPLDPQRDGWVLPLIPRVIDRGMPLFAICRGFQEANVALGGSLHQAVQELDGKHDHRARSDTSADVQYGPSHEVFVQAGGALEPLLEGLLEASPQGRRITVNSVHGQGVDRLAAGLRIEALAPDGLVEAFTVSGARGFNLAVQWHPEWQAADNPVSVRLFHAFGNACNAYRHQRRARRAEPVPDR